MCLAPTCSTQTTINMTPNQYRKLTETAPYLVAMSLKDMLELKFEPDSNQIDDQFVPSIPTPANEPTIGVIDTCFDEKNAYFSKWVEYHNELDSQIDINPKDLVHGTEVTSLIVDGPTLNPALDDGCGRFSRSPFRRCQKRQQQFFYHYENDSQHRIQQSRH